MMSFFVWFIIRAHIVTFGMMTYVYMCAAIFNKSQSWAHTLVNVLCMFAGGMLSNYIFYGLKGKPND